MEDLKKRIQNEIKEALRSGDSFRRTVLGMLMAAIQNKEIERRGQGKEEQLSNDDITAIIGTEVKKRRDAVEQYEKGDRPALAQKEKDEKAILEKYLPEQMGEEEVSAEIKKVIEEVGAHGMQDLGKVMGPVMQKLKGKADGSLVNRIVKEQLSN